MIILRCDNYILLIIYIHIYSFTFMRFGVRREAMLEDEHPDWLDPVARRPLSTMEPLEDFEEDCENAPEDRRISIIFHHG